MTASSPEPSSSANAEIQATALFERIAECPGESIGPYKLLQVIGEGGMGVVFMAEQSRPIQRRVALKVIKPGMDSKQVVARFEAERQALALMDHQNIAKVFDAGTTTSGRPYFVMELVQGTPITRFCDERRLSPRARLELFVPVCQAIQHAHQKGIIHRDIKPSNVLVTMYDDRAVPKVIDFGVAKAMDRSLTEMTMFTQFGAIVGTFEYMSPEQAEMNALGVDTRSDVYSLGVLLYEILTGTPPLERERLRKSGLDEMLRIIREEEPPRPSQRLSQSGDLPKIAASRGADPTRLAGLIRGDVDWIVMKCLEKERTRRYESANGLARDIQRHLADEPVEACPPGASYRARKFMRRHRASLAVAAALALTLVAGTAFSAWQAARASRAERSSAKERDTALEKQAETSRAQAETVVERNRVAAANGQLTRALGDLRNALYVSDMNRAFQYASQGNMRRVEELLARHRPRDDQDDLRGVEWRYLDRLCAKSRETILLDVGGSLNAVAISPQDESMAVARSDGVLQVFDLQSAQERFSKTDLNVALLGFSADGESFIALCSDGARGSNSREMQAYLRAFSSRNGEELEASRKSLMLGEVGQSALARDGRLLIGFAGEGKARVWQTSNLEPVATLDAYAQNPPVLPAFMHFLALSQDAKSLAWQLGPTTTIWDLATEKLLFRNTNEKFWSFALALSPDGEVLACHRGGPPHVVQLWKWRTSELIHEFPGLKGHVYQLAFSPDGRTLAAGDELSVIRLWDTTDFRELRAFQGHSGLLMHLNYSSDGAILYSASRDGEARAWKTRADPAPDIVRDDLANLAIRLSFSADGKRLTLAARPKASDAFVESVEIDVLRRQAVTRRRWQIALNISENGRVALLGEKVGPRVTLVDAISGHELGSLENNELAKGMGKLSPEGGYLALVGAEGAWVSPTSSPADRRVLPGADVRSLVFSANDRRLAVSRRGSNGATDAIVELWDLSSWKRIAILPGSAEQMFFSKDDQLLGLVRENEMAVWGEDSSRPRAVLTFPSAIDSAWTGFWVHEFSPIDSMWAVANENLVHVFDTNSGELLTTLKGHRGPVVDLAWSPDGRTLATANGADVKLWNVVTREEITTFVGENGVQQLEFSSTGTLAIADQMNVIRFWEATPLAPKAAIP